MENKIPRGVFTANWARKKNYIIKYLRAKKKPKHPPRFFRIFGGAENFKEVKGTLFYRDLEIVLDPDRREKILSEQEESYGGSKAIYYRLRKKYLGITYNHVLSYLNRSERRQLKRTKQSSAKQRSFIHASRPGHLQIDLTFYHNNKFIVFGCIDVFSRWCHYELIKDKTPKSTAAALQKVVALFKSLAPQMTLFMVSTDAGSEFQDDFRAFLENYKEDPKKHPKWKLRIEHKKQPQRLIETLNGTLRKYVERVDFKDKKELAKIVARFVEEYNNSRHYALGTRTPMEVITLKDPKLVKRESERQFAQKKKRVTTSKFVMKELKVGSLVRISLQSDKDALGHHGAKPLWSKTIYRVKRIIGSKRGIDRYQVVYEGNGKKKGIYFRDKLLFVRLPTHNKNQKAKYDPGAVDETEVPQDDDPPAPAWKDPKLKTYANKQDEREDSGEEYDEIDLDLADQDTEDEDEKLEHPPPAPKKKVVKPRKQKEVKVKKSLLRERLRTTLYNNNCVVIDEYRGYHIVFFRGDKSVLAVLPKEIHYLLNEQITEKTRLKYLKEHAETIKASKREVDEDLEAKDGSS